MRRGKLITIYGINNIGKSTHSKKLIERLKTEGHDAVYVKYPVYEIEPTGSFLNTVLRGTGGQKISEDELQLWFILNRYEFQPRLKEMIDEGKIVIAEDYIGTGIAWGMAKGLEKDWLMMANKFLLKEDFAILFEGERDLRAKESGHIHEQDDSLAAKCQKIFSDLGREFGWMKLEVQEKIEDTAAILWKLVKKNL